ncbi:cystathionine gamma-lyase [Plakobranchus ocellatus]|uniref:Cystathionine gamma-lyase n=1 Tax=Plakobranchus ocellatus TaxID=259542 RepID=A0AAV4CBS1_9GAST|nr:cystathionine gamma-lyase [Plakobranchus ocellatus]
MAVFTAAEKRSTPESNFPAQRGEFEFNNNHAFHDLRTVRVTPGGVPLLFSPSVCEKATIVSFHQTTIQSPAEAMPLQPVVRHLSIREAPAKSNFDQALEGLTLDDVSSTSALVSCQHAFSGTHTTPLVVPIYHSSTYIMDRLEDGTPAIIDGSSVYSRLGNPTCEMTEAAINAVERGAGSLTFASGMAAVTSVFLGFLNTGDHVSHLKKPIPMLQLLWLETPCNPNILIVDVQAVLDLVKDRDILVGVDSTFASPHCQQMMKLGVDFCMHSCSKYIGGHSDLIGGCVTTRTVEQWRILKHVQGTFGNMLSPHDASLLLRGLRTLPLRMKRHSETALEVARYLDQHPKSPHDASLLLRGLRTLPLRMKRHSETALEVARYLDQHPKVERVNYPGLESHPQHEIAKRQMTGGYSGMIMAEIKGGSKGGETVAENVRIFRMAVSLGGVQSILEHPYTMTHGKYLLSEEETKNSGVTPGMLRISIGLEDAADLIADFKQALEKVEL